MTGFQSKYSGDRVAPSDAVADELGDATLILVLLTAFVLQGGTAETSGPDRELLARGRRVGEVFRDAINHRDPAAFRETFAPSLQQAWNLDEVATILDTFRHLQGKATFVKQARRLHDFGDADVVEVRLASALCDSTLLRFGLGPDWQVESFGFSDEPRPDFDLTMNAIAMLPVRGEWTVVAGGGDPGSHHMTGHVIDHYAVDLAVCDDAEEPLDYRGDGTKREDYFAFGREVVAAGRGRVVTVVHDVPDNEPGFGSQLYTAGNQVVIKSSGPLCMVYAHLKEGSVKVKVGDEVVPGQPIAECGCSGAAGFPHLHFGVVDDERVPLATGRRITFMDVVVKRDGREFEMKRYEPKQGDRVRPCGELPSDGLAPVPPRTDKDTAVSRPSAPEVVHEEDLPSRFASVDDGRIVGRRFAEAVNQGDGRPFRDLFNDAMKQTFSLEELDSDLADFAEDHGRIVRSHYSLTENIAEFRYATERGVVMMDFVLESDGSVGGYKEQGAAMNPVPAGNLVPLALPVKGRWAVRWGGADPKGNPHMTLSEIARYAVDFVVPEDEEVHFYEGLRNEDFAAFGREVLAAAAGEVVMAVDGNPDNPPGHADLSSTVGNAILVRHAEHEYALYGHLQRDSVAVKVGDQIQAGQTIARCGNSGATMRPHLQFGMINDADASLATGFPFTFRDVVVTRDGRDQTPEAYEPRAGDRLRPR